MGHPSFRVGTHGRVHRPTLYSRKNGVLSRNFFSIAMAAPPGRAVLRIVRYRRNDARIASNKEGYEMATAKKKTVKKTAKKTAKKSAKKPAKKAAKKPAAGKLISRVLGAYRVADGKGEYVVAWG